MSGCVAAARNAFDTGPWPKTPPAGRAALLRKLGELLRANADALAALESRDAGKPFKETAFRDVPLARNVAAFGELGLSGEVRPVSHTIRRATEATKLGFTRVIAPENARTLVAAIDLALVR